MSNMVKPKGTKDIFGRRQEVRSIVKETLKAVASVFNFKEIETPIFEKKEVYVRSVGETSDIVSKEMFEFQDKKGREMVLRPEGTAGTIRAIVENKLFAKLPLKVFYMGPMFRYEQPQKGRQRQFTQFGVEMLSDKSPYADAEIILMGDMILKSLQIPAKLIINSLGDQETRQKYAEGLRTYFADFKDQLTEDSINRLEKNPMRILDDKVDGQKDFVKNAPKISEYYTEETKEYFKTITDYLINMKIDFEIDPTMVRGLDYYSHTAFEFVSTTDVAGSQSTIIGGGRYENLVKEFGGPNVSGIGFGLGLERLVNEYEEITKDEDLPFGPDVFVLNISPEVQAETITVVQVLRSHGIKTDWNLKPTKIQKAFTKADASGAPFQIIAGAKELLDGKVIFKVNGEQETISVEDLVSKIVNYEGVKNEKN